MGKVGDQRAGLAIRQAGLAIAHGLASGHHRHRYRGGSLNRRESENRPCVAAGCQQQRG